MDPQAHKIHETTTKAINTALARVSTVKRNESIDLRFHQPEKKQKKKHILSTNSAFTYDVSNWNSSSHRDGKGRTLKAKTSQKYLHSLEYARSSSCF